MKKKVTRLVTAGILSASMLAETVSAAEVSWSEPGVFPIVEEPVELTVWAILSPGSIDDYETNHQSEWYEEYSGVVVHWVNVPRQGWADSFQTSIMSGDYPDIYLYDFSTQEVTICAEYGAIIPLEELIEENCPNVKAALDEDPELKKNITSGDGHIYTLYTEAYNTGAFSQKLWVNKSWLEEYSKDTGNGMPETTEDFKDMLLYFKEHDMNHNGEMDEIPYLGVNGMDGIYNLVGSFVPNSSGDGYGCYIGEDGELSFAFNTEEFREALKYLNELHEAGCISDQTFTMDTTTRYEYTSGKPEEAVVGVATGASINNVVQPGAEGSLDYSDYVAVPPLEGPEGVRSATSPSGENTVSLKNAITTKCEYPEIAAKWLDYWYSEEGRLWSVNGGLEGQDWWYEEGDSLSEDGTILVHSEEALTTPNFCWSGSGANYALTEEDLRHMDLSQLGTNSQLATYQANLQYRPYKTEFCWSSFVWAGNSDESIEYSELYKLVFNEVENSYSEFIIGKRDIRDDTQWDAYVGKLSDIGVERFVELVKYYTELKNS